MNPLVELSSRRDRLDRMSSLFSVCGKIVSIDANMFSVAGISDFVNIGDVVIVEDEENVLGEVIGIDCHHIMAKLFDDRARFKIGSSCCVATNLELRPSKDWRGRVLDALGRPIDGRGPIPNGNLRYERLGKPPASYNRDLVTSPVETGIKVIDTFMPICRGQRMGVFAGSGVGKSTLLSMFARSTDFDLIIVALIGERGREVREFVVEVLGGNLSRSVVVVSTSDESAIMRRSGAETAMAIAEAMRDQGLTVLLIVDSVTRYAQSLREIALASGEPPVSRGFPASTFGDVAKLLERAGPGLVNSGSITAVLSVLVDGDDHNDPISDAIRGILDGHIVLDRDLANRGQYPAVNVSSSVSRLAHRAWTSDQADLVSYLRRLVSVFEESRDIIAMNGHVIGRDSDIDLAISIVPRLYEWLRQTPSSPPIENCLSEMCAVFDLKN